MKSKGKVYLVGAGPGDPGLITQRGAELLRQADLVVYDHLVNPQVLRHTKPGCHKIYAGKTFREHTMTQREINRLLLKSSRKNQVVVRLKGGDPFVFGRGGEEAIELKRARIPFEVVPGVSSAIGGPAYAGIPLTHREHNSIVSIVTGHEDPTKNGSHLNWAKLAQEKATLVFLMGVGQLPQIAAKLIENGLSPRTPAAVISWATWAQQQTFTGTLESIPKIVKQNKVLPPALIVIGSVVGLRRKIAWLEKRPLFGRRIVVTRARSQASELSERLIAKGADVVEFPTIRIEPPSRYAALDREIYRLQVYDWILFTSANGVEHFFSRLNAAGKDARALAMVRVGAIGPATAQSLAERGITVDFLPKEFVAEAVVRELARSQKLKGKKILIPRAKEAREVLAEGLRRKGAEVTEVAAYQTKIDRQSKKEVLENLKAFPPDVVTFTSSSTVKNFLELVGKKNLRRIFGKTRFVSIGPVTTQTAKQLGIRVAAQAKTYTIPGLVTAVEKTLR